METVKAHSSLAKKIQYEYLESGRFTIGSKLPTVVQLAKQYDVSPPTVRKAAGLLVDKGWLSKKQGSGIYIESLPKALRTKLGYISTNFRFPIENHVLEGINNYMANSGNSSSLEVATSRDDVKAERHQVQTMQRNGVKGVIICCCSDYERGSYEDYLACEFRDYPIVVVDIYSPKMRRPHVIMDNRYAGYEMTKYLLDQGRRKVAFIKLDKIFSRSVEDRFIGYKQALEEAGIPLASEYIIESDIWGSPEAHNAILERLISPKPRPDAIIALSDEFVPIVIKFLRSRSIVVPQDMIVAGFDNLHTNFTDDVWPTTKPDFIRMGEQATDLLLKMIESRDFTPTGVVLPCPILVPGIQQSETINTSGSKVMS